MGPQSWQSLLLHPVQKAKHRGWDMGMQGVSSPLRVQGPSLLLILQHPKKIYGLTAASGSNIDCVMGVKQRVGFFPQLHRMMWFP